jgi:hypothetical protein
VSLPDSLSGHALPIRPFEHLASSLPFPELSPSRPPFPTTRSFLESHATHRIFSFIPSALREGPLITFGANSFPCHTSEKRAKISFLAVCKSFRCHKYRNTARKSFPCHTYKKQGVVGLLWLT